MVRRSSIVFAASLAVLAILSPAAAAAPAGHGGEKPKYYFPKHVKRMIVTNSTTSISSTSAKEPFHTPPEPLPFNTPVVETPTITPSSTAIVVPPTTTTPEAAPPALNPLTPTTTSSSTTSLTTSSTTTSPPPVVHKTTHKHPGSKSSHSTTTTSSPPPAVHETTHKHPGSKSSDSNKAHLHTPASKQPSEPSPISSAAPNSTVVTSPSTTPSSTTLSIEQQQATSTPAAVSVPTPSSSVATVPSSQQTEPSDSLAPSTTLPVPTTTPKTQLKSIDTAAGQQGSDSAASTTNETAESASSPTGAAESSTTAPVQPSPVLGHSEGAHITAAKPSTHSLVGPNKPAHQDSTTRSKPGIFPPEQSTVHPGTGQGSTTQSSAQQTEQSSPATSQGQQSQETGSGASINPIPSLLPTLANSGTDHTTTTKDGNGLSNPVNTNPASASGSNGSHPESAQSEPTTSSSTTNNPVFPLPIHSHATKASVSKAVSSNKGQSPKPDHSNTLHGSKPDTAQASASKTTQSRAAQVTQNSAQSTKTTTAKASASKAGQSQAAQVTSNTQNSAQTSTQKPAKSNTDRASGSKAGQSQAAQSTQDTQNSAKANTQKPVKSSNVPASASKASQSRAAQGSQTSAQTSTEKPVGSGTAKESASKPAQSQPINTGSSPEQSSTPKPIIPKPIPSTSNGIGIGASISAGSSGVGAGISAGISGANPETHHPVKTTVGQGKPTTTGAASTGRPGSADSIVPIVPGKPKTGSTNAPAATTGTLVGASNSVVNSGPSPSKPSSGPAQISSEPADSTSGRGGIVPVTRRPKPTTLGSVPIIISGSDTTFTTNTPVTKGAGSSTVAQPSNSKNPPAGTSGVGKASKSAGLPSVVPIPISKSGSIIVTNLPAPTASNSGNLPPVASNSKPVVSLPVVVSQPDTTFTTNIPITNPAGALSTAAAAVTSGSPTVLSVPITISNSDTTFTTDVPISNPGSVISSILGGAVTSKVVPVHSAPGTKSNGDTRSTPNLPINSAKPSSASGNAEPTVVLPTPSKSHGAVNSLSIDRSKTARPASGTLVGVSNVVTPGSPKSTPGQDSGSVKPASPNSQTKVHGSAAHSTATAVTSGTGTGGIVVPHTSGTPDRVSPSGSEPSNVSQTGSHPGASQSLTSGPSASKSGSSEPQVTSGNSDDSTATGTNAKTTGSAAVAGAKTASSHPGAVGTTPSDDSGAASATRRPSANPALGQQSTHGVQPAPTSVFSPNVKSQSQQFANNKPGPTSLKPISTDTFTSQAVPSSIIVAPPKASSATQSQDFTETGIPSSLPHVITPPGGAPDQPPNTTLVQVGFLYPLNYPFVLANTLSQKQIFKYVPPGIAYGLGIDEVNVTMQTLRAYDTTDNLHYITTLALAYVPSAMVDKLSLDLHTPAMPIYHNPDASVKTLFSMVNPALPIRADDTGSSATSGAAGGPSASASGNIQPGSPIGGGIGNDMPVRPSSVGIGVGVVCGAAAYGAAMFFVARRYKQRRLSHQRSPSLLSSPVMSGSNPDTAVAGALPLMSGGRGDGGRSTSPMDGYGFGRNSRGSGRSGSTGRQQISAPVMAENSLGWN